LCPSALAASMEQESTGLSSTKTVQRPQLEVSQPLFTLFIPTLLKKSSKNRSGSISAFSAFPFNSHLISIFILLPAPRLSLPIPAPDGFGIRRSRAYWFRWASSPSHRQQTVRSLPGFLILSKYHPDPALRLPFPGGRPLRSATLRP